MRSTVVGAINYVQETNNNDYCFNLCARECRWSGGTWARGIEGTHRGRNNSIYLLSKAHFSAGQINVLGTIRPFVVARDKRICFWTLIDEGEDGGDNRRRWVINYRLEDELRLIPWPFVYRKWCPFVSGWLSIPTLFRSLPPTCGWMTIWREL